MNKEKRLDVGAGTSEFREGTKESRPDLWRTAHQPGAGIWGWGKGSTHNKAGSEAFEKNKLEIRINCYFQDNKFCWSNADSNRKGTEKGILSPASTVDKIAYSMYVFLTKAIF